MIKSAGPVEEFGIPGLHQDTSETVSWLCLYPGCINGFCII